MQFARYIPLPWFRKQHKVGLNDPKLDPYIEEVCRMGLKKGIMVTSIFIVWSWLIIPTIILMLMEYFVEWLRRRLKPVSVWVNKWSGHGWAWDKVDQLEQKRIKHAVEARKKAGYG